VTEAEYFVCISQLTEDAAVEQQGSSQSKKKLIFTSLNPERLLHLRTKVHTDCLRRASAARETTKRMRNTRNEFRPAENHQSRCKMRCTNINPAEMDEMDLWVF